MRLALPVLALLLAIAGCATPAQQIATRLGDYGVPPVQARCMGDRLQQRLSLSQLRRLNEIGKLSSDRMGKMSISEIAGKLTDPRDPTLVAEFVRAGIGCAV